MGHRETLAHASTEARLLDIDGLDASVLRTHMPALFRGLEGSVPTRLLFKLADEFGGIRVYVPAHPNTSSLLAGILSPEEFTTLCAALGGEEITVPSAHALRRVLRNREMISRVSGGQAVRDVARHFKLCERSVWKVLARHRSAQHMPAARAAQSTPAKKRSKER
jgi:Mor family transcriptional regulator